MNNNNMTIGVFDDQAKAENALHELEAAGYNPKDISVIMKDSQQAQTIQDNTGANVGKGAASGIMTGGVVGGIAGLLIGIGAIVVPGIGGILVGGPILAALGIGGVAGTTLSGAMTGALAGGLVGALVGLGVPEEEAKVYEQKVQQGAILLMVPTSSSNLQEANSILQKYSSQEIRQVHTK